MRILVKIMGVDTVFLKKVLTHEYMHVLSLQNNQINKPSTVDKKSVDKTIYDLEEQTCSPNYYNLYGCFKDSSYISKFYKKFWIGSLKEEYDRIQKISGKDQFQDEMSKWKSSYSNKFISDIASQSPEEDLAESFSIWVVDQSSSKLNTEQKEKVDFFSQFPELRLIKETLNELR